MGKSNQTKLPRPINLTDMSEHDLVDLRAALEVEMRRRGIGFSVGQIGESLVIDYFNHTTGLPKLRRSAPGTKNVDALSRNGERYSIKTIWNAKKTGTIYPDDSDRDRQLFEFLLIAQLNDNLTLKTIYEFSWKQFTEVRSWDKRMNAWYVGCSTKNFNKGKNIQVRS